MADILSFPSQQAQGLTFLDRQLRELLAEVKVRSQDAVRAKDAAEAAGAEAKALQDQVEDLAGQLKAARQLASKSESMLKDEINEKTELRESLHKQRRENDGLATRAQELELELRMSTSGAQLPDPALQMEPS